MLKSNFPPIMPAINPNGTPMSRAMNSTPSPTASETREP